jgi:hypothetical protein
LDTLCGKGAPEKKVWNEQWAPYIAEGIGTWARFGEVAKRIDSVATALFHTMSIDGLNELDLSYTPPLSSPWYPVQMSAQVWQASL